MRYENEAVNNGIELLNEYFGSTSWVNDVDVDRINQYSLTDCVITQLFGGYSDGIDILLSDIDEDSQVDVQYDHGFDWDGSFSRLDDEWKLRIQDLQEGNMVSEVPSTHAEAVDNGVERLNEYFGGTHWIDNIDTSILAQHNPRKCVIGQQWDGEFIIGLEALGIRDHASDYGYSIGMWGSYQDLTDEWVERIESMRAENPTSPTTTLSLHICTTVTVDVDDTTLGRLYREAREYGVNVETLLEERFTEVAIEATHEIDV